MYRFWMASLILFLVALGAVPVSAQSLGADPLTVTINPQYPAPYSTITITPSSSLYDLSASTVTISVNGKVIATGTGSEGANYAVGASGETDTITVTAATPDGTFSASATVVPSSVSLIEEPLSTTHPFYAGGALVAPQGRVRFVAMADLRKTAGGTPIPTSSLVYTWKSGDQILEDSSGIGRSTLIADAPQRYRDTNVSVTVSTPDGSISGQSSVDVSPANTALVIYNEGPLLGPMFDVAVGSAYSMQGSESSFIAVPYFFAEPPALSWSVDGAVSGDEPVVTVRTTGSNAGSATLSVDANESGSYESANSVVTVNFGAGSGSTGFLGL